MPLSDDHDLDPVLSTEEYPPPTNDDFLESLLFPIDVSMPPTEASRLRIDENLLSTRESHVEFTTAVRKNNYENWVPVNPPDDRVLTKKFVIDGHNISHFKCTFYKCNYLIDKKDHCVRHYKCIHTNNGKPVKGKRKFTCNDGTSVPQNRKAQPFAKVISKSAPPKRQSTEKAKVISKSPPPKRQSTKKDKVFSNKIQEGRIHFDAGSKLGINLSFGEFEINRFTIIQT